MILFISIGIAAISILIHAGILIMQKSGKILLTALYSAVFIFTLIYFLEKSFELGIPALINAHYGLVFLALSMFSAIIICNLLNIFLFNQVPAFLSGVISLAFLLLSVSPIFLPAQETAMPALRSKWLFFHVGFSFIGIALFTIAAAGAIYYFFKPNILERQRIENKVYRTILSGYIFYTIGALIFGAIWAYYAWGRFWGWDPKETWALITWIGYTIYLHFRLRRRASERIRMVLALIAYALTIFTFFGVNYLYSSLHSYG